ncbi:hypothetical protein llap_21130 [Limosa lapponica baueri]|uniref:EF-hand domain-containing protein n=1 Tax=Limosa lapponica baueri TaxID=1758121 RepID=A0A2I0T446_LIMLA|nr:hypothetical protein llap_21130 [Limosa lapponica baueri]
MPCKNKGLDVVVTSARQRRVMKAHDSEDTGNRRAADKLICDLDENKDGRISFEEYWTLIGGIASPIAQIIRQQELSVKHTK